MPAVLRGPRVTLRPPEPGDIDVRLALGRDPEIHRLYGGNQAELRPMTREDAVAAHRWLMEHPHAWVIERGRFIGHVRLDHVNRRDKWAVLAIGIADPGALGQGLGPEAIGLVASHAFGELGLHRLSLRVLAFNERAIRAYKKCGFRVEGRERESALIDGEWHDDVIMGLLAGDLPPDQGRREGPAPQG